SSPLLGLFPAYVVKLSPGEALVVPGEFGLYIGDAQQMAFPRMENVKRGRYWVVQPISIHALTQAEAARAATAQSNVAHMVTVRNREGKASQRTATTVPARDGGTQLYAKIQIEVGMTKAAASGENVVGQTRPSSGGAPSQPPAAPATLPGDDAPRSVAAGAD